MTVIDTLITDRTAADVSALKQLMSKSFASMTTAEQTAWLANSKGAYNTSDMNRVGTALNYLKQVLTDQCGKYFKWAAKTDWLYTDIPTLTQLQTYVAWIADIRTALTLPNGVPAVPTMSKLTWQQANDIEQILVVCDQLIANLMTAFKYTNAAECSTGGLI